MPLATASRLALACTVGAFGALAAACGARTPLFGDDTSDAGQDAIEPSETGTPDAGAPDAPPDVGPACMPAAITDAACNDLVPSGPPVTVQCETGAVPMPSGGTVVDGTYEMVSSRFFGPMCPSDDVEQIVWATCGSAWATAEVLMTSSVPTTFLYADGVVTFSGTSVALAASCATTPSSSRTFGYDATPDSLTLYIYGYTGGGVRVDEFARQ